MTSLKTDIAVIGAGPNGLAAALALGSARLLRPLTVVVIDPQDPRARAAKPDPRSSALTKATQAMFSALGVNDDLQPHLQEMRDIIVTDDALEKSERPALLSFATDQNAKSAAAMIENHILLGALINGINASPSISLMTGHAVTAFSFGPGPAILTLANGDQVKAQLVVAADGRNSRARGAAGIACDAQDYAQSAITLTVAHELPHNGRAEEHFTPQGVFAILPLSQSRSSIVWTETHAEAQRIVALPDDQFQVALEKRFGSHLGKLTVVGGRNAHRLSAQIAKSFIADRLALVGDAAHVIHPLAGLGLNLGFKDAAALAEIISDAAAIGEDIGNAGVLERYQRQRRFDTLATTALIDGMNRLFANSNPALKILRGTGLRLVDRIPFAKETLMQQAAGTEGDLPRLMRGLV
jgi:2-octaprenyl-6-methoxyphenol hydroxylase